MEKIGVDFAIAGNHDLDEGHEHFELLIKDLST